jgi:signal transduction histidine kinase
VVVSVRDAGPGLTSEEQGRIFQMPPAAGQAGTGVDRRIGLVLASQLVQRMAGEIWCDSELGHGTRVSFKLPEVGAAQGGLTSEARD